MSSIESVKQNLKEMIRSNNFDNRNVLSNLENISNLISNDQILTEGFSSEQIWYQLENEIKKQLDGFNGLYGKVITKEDEMEIEEEVNNDNLANEDNIEKLKNEEYDSEGEYNDMDEENIDFNNVIEKIENKNNEDNIIDENTNNVEDNIEDKNINGEIKNDNNNDDNNNVEDNNNDESEFEDEQEEYERFMEEIDEKGLKAMDNDVNAKDYEEAQLHEDDKNSEEESEEEEKKFNTDEDLDDVFNTMAYGTSNQNFENLENKLLSKKSWQLQGEVRGMQREKNGLIQENLDFEAGVRSKLIISEENNKSIEDIIKQRIMDLVFDDRKISDYKNDKDYLKEQSKDFPELNFEKDQRGLIGIYEQEYKKNILGVDDVKKKDDKVKVQISELFKAICYSIDHMSRLNFTPGNNNLMKDNKASDEFVIDEKVPIFIKSKTITKESYQDIHRALKKDLKTKEEMTTQEKSSLRRKIKKYKKIKKKKINEKEMEKTGLSLADIKLLEKNKNLIKKQNKDSKVKRTNYTRSSQFFNNLQENNNNK